MIPNELRHDLKNVYTTCLQASIIEEGAKVYVLFSGYKLPPSIYSKPSTDLLVFTTELYPKAGFDMFWTDHDLTLAGGRVPNGAVEIEEHIGRRWRRFSYHPYQGKPWKPSEDSLVSFVSYIDQRLARGD